MSNIKWLGCLFEGIEQGESIILCTSFLILDTMVNVGVSNGSPK